MSTKCQRSSQSVEHKCDEELQKELSHMSAIAKQNEVAGRPKLSDFCMYQLVCILMCLILPM